MARRRRSKRLLTAAENTPGPTLRPKRRYPNENKPEIREQAPPVANGDEATELKEFVQNYLDLADTAMGFSRRTGVHKQLTISTCRQCQHTIAATDVTLLAFVESLHVCREKREAAPQRETKIKEAA